MYSANSVPTFRNIFKGQEIRDFLAHEDGTDRLSRNAGKELALHAA